MLKRIIFLFLISIVFVSISFATSTAFWRQYKLKPVKGYYPYGPKGVYYGPYGLFPLNSPNFSDYTGFISGVEKIGEVSYSSQGRFKGGCAVFNGKGAIKYITSKVYPSTQISIEAWIKVKQYPEDKGYIVYREPVVPGGTNYKLNKTCGFSLYIDSQGRLNLSVTNIFYGYTITTSSPAGVIPLNKWVWVAGISGTFRDLYVNGKLVTQKGVSWGQGLMGIETVPGPIYIGNNEKDDEGFIGEIDQVRIDNNVYKFWPKENMSWALKNNGRKIPAGPPYFLKNNEPIFYLPLDGNFTPAINKIGNVQITSQGRFSDKGIKGESFIASENGINLYNSHLLSEKQGSIEYWFQPRGYNTLSDWGVGNMDFGPAHFYIQYTGGPGNKSLALYFYLPKNKGGIEYVFANDWIVHDGKWQQVIITWKDKDIRIYINGKLKGENQNHRIPGDKWINNVHFGAPNQFDEIYLYNKVLTPGEVHNAYYRYRDPKKLNTNIKELPLQLSYAGYLPSYNEIYYKLVPQGKEQINQLKLELWKNNKIQIFQKDVIFNKKEQDINIPSLNNGKYELEFYGFLNGHLSIVSKPFLFVRKHFIWENNTLGKTDIIYPPYLPIKTDGSNVSVVLRKYQMNGFGLWNKVISQGKNILSGPIVIKYTTQNGQGKWENISQPKLIKSKPIYAIYSSRAVASPVQIKTISKVEFDGTMKVKMQMSPGNIPQEIDQMYIDIPIKEKYAKLFTEYVDTIRVNYAGRLMKGNGVVWTGAMAKRQNVWQNSFVPYVWLGTETRGLAWFGENDKGWITKKHGSKRPIQEIIRVPGEVILRIYLINKKTVIKQIHKLVFGLDVSPTKPMPKDWRLRLPYMPGGLAVNPWGGLDCSYKTPYKNHWSVVDKIVEARNKMKVTKGIVNWFKAFDKKYNPPPAYGTWPWLTSVLYFAGVAANTGPDRPMAVYIEEMGASTVRKNWKTYQYEWSSEAYPPTMYNWPNYNVYRQGISVDESAGTTFIKSYRDYGVYVANQWLKRGVSIYWDNNFPHISYNFRTTAAYKTSYGAIQPCITIWNERKYMRRVWNVLAYWREHRKPPTNGWKLQWTIHMTNEMFIPLITWGTVELDFELVNSKPAVPAFLRTESIGSQVGNYPLCLHNIAGDVNKIVTDLPTNHRETIEWAMRFVNGIAAPDTYEKTYADLNKIVYGFGYGKKDIKVYEYWATKPILRCNNNDVKWVVLVNRDTKQMLLVFSSWNPKKVEIKVNINPERLGFNIDNKKIMNILTGETIGNNQGEFNLTLSAPYGVKIIKIE